MVEKEIERIYKKPTLKVQGNFCHEIDLQPGEKLLTSEEQHAVEILNSSGKYVSPDTVGIILGWSSEETDTGKYDERINHILFSANQKLAPLFGRNYLLYSYERGQYKTNTRGLEPTALPKLPSTISLDGNEIKLSNTEFLLFQSLAKHKGKVTPFSLLGEELWKTSNRRNKKNNIKLYIHYLRRKIEENHENPKLVRNVWGKGVALDLAHDEESPVFRTFETFRVDMDSRIIYWEDEKGPTSQKLTPKEFLYFLQILDHSGRVLSYRDVQEIVWPEVPSEDPSGMNYIRLYISYLRRKLPFIEKEKLVTTLWNFGLDIKDLHEKNKEIHQTPMEIITVGPLQINPSNHSVSIEDGPFQYLTATEFRLLEWLSREPGKIMKNIDFIDESLEHTDIEDPINTLRMAMVSLRRKLDDPQREENIPFIATRISHGYRLNIPLSEEILTSHTIPVTKNIFFNSARLIIQRDNEEISLTSTEAKLLQTLLSYRGRILPHTFLIQKVWPDGTTLLNLRVYIGYVREKLGDTDRTIIKTEKDFGYTLV